MINWQEISSDPNDKLAMSKVHEYLMEVRIIMNKGRPLDFILNHVRNKKVLDIGVCEHDLKYIESPDWKHRKIVEASAETVGLDIIESLVNKLNEKGFNVLVADATGKDDLGQRFDAVVIGDVIEHVNDPVALLKFAKRHLNEGGEIYVTTPNPLSNSIIKEMRNKETHIANLDHVAWFTPSQALELARRSGMFLKNYVCFINKTRIKRAKLFGKPISEQYTDDFLYIFS